MINTIDSIAKNMTKDFIPEKPAKHHLPKKPAKDLAKNTAESNSANDYYFHSSERSQIKNHVSVITKANIKGSKVKICGYSEKGLLVGWGINGTMFYSRVDNECIAGWFGMMCENDNLVVGEILRSVEEYKERHKERYKMDVDSKAEKIPLGKPHNIEENNKNNNYKE